MSNSYLNYATEVLEQLGFSVKRVGMAYNPVMQSISRLFIIVFILVIRVGTGDLLVAGVPVWIWAKYLYLYLRQKVLTVEAQNIFRSLIITYSTLSYIWWPI